MIPWWAALLVSMALIVWSLFCIGIGGLIANGAQKRREIEKLIKDNPVPKKPESNVFPWPERES